MKTIRSFVSDRRDTAEICMILLPGVLAFAVIFGTLLSLDGNEANATVPDPRARQVEAMERQAKAMERIADELRRMRSDCR